MFTTTPSDAASASASTSPSRGSIRSGRSLDSGMIWAGTRSAVVLRMCDTPHSASERRRAWRPSSPCESK